MVPPGQPRPAHPCRPPLPPAEPVGRARTAGLTRSNFCSIVGRWGRKSCRPGGHRRRSCLCCAAMTYRAWTPGRPCCRCCPPCGSCCPAGACGAGRWWRPGRWSLLCLALAAGASAAGAWCAVAGLPQLGVAAAAGAGLDPGRMLLVADPGTGWPQVVTSLLDGCELVLLRPPDRPSARVRRRLEATLRRCGGRARRGGGLGRCADQAARRPPGMGRDRAGARAAACPPGPGGGGRPGRGGAAAGAVAVAAGARRLGAVADETGAPCVAFWPKCGEPGDGGGSARPGAGGVVPGLAGAARTRSPRLRAGGAVVEEFCPRVEVLRPGACAIGARGPARYFGGEEALAGKIIEAVAGARRSPARSASPTACSPRSSPPAPRPGRGHTPHASRRARRGRSLPRTRSASLGTRNWPDLLPRLGIRTLGEFAALPASRGGEPVRGAGSARAPAGPRPGSPAAGTPPALRRPLRVRCRVRPARPSRPSPWCSPPRRSPSRCTPASPPSGWPAYACRYRCSARTGRRSPGCGGTTGCFPPWRWPSGCAGSWPAGGPSSRRARTTGIQAGGITLLRLIPDQLVRAHGPSARPVGRRGGQRPGSARRPPGAGHARARRGDAPGAGRRPWPGGSGDAGAVRRCGRARRFLLTGPGRAGSPRRRRPRSTRSRCRPGSPTRRVPR